MWNDRKTSAGRFPGPRCFDYKGSVSCRWHRLSRCMHSTPPGLARINWPVSQCRAKRAKQIGPPQYRHVCVFMGVFSLDNRLLTTSASCGTLHALICEMVSPRFASKAGCRLALEIEVSLTLWKPLVSAKTWAGFQRVLPFSWHPTSGF